MDKGYKCLRKSKQRSRAHRKKKLFSKNSIQNTFFECVLFFISFVGNHTIGIEYTIRRNESIRIYGFYSDMCVVFPQHRFIEMLSLYDQQSCCEYKVNNSFCVSMHAFAMISLRFQNFEMALKVIYILFCFFWCVFKTNIQPSVHKQELGQYSFVRIDTLSNGNIAITYRAAHSAK